MNIKKFLIIILLIVPILITLAVTSAAKIVAIRTPDNPNIIEVRDRHNRVISSEDTIESSIHDANDFIIINIFPEITKDKSLTFEVDKEISVGDISFEQIENTTNRYRITPIEVGFAQVIITANSNVRLKAKVNFEVTSNHINKISIIDAQRSILSVGTNHITPMYAGERLSSEIFPISALEKGSQEWLTAPNDVIDIDANGQITVLKRAYVELSLGAFGIDAQFTQARALLDFSSAIVKRNIAYTSELIDHAWILNNLVFEEIKSEVIISGDKNPYTVEHQGKTVSVNVYSCEKNKLGFLDGLERIYTNNGEYRLLFGDLEKFARLDFHNAESSHYKKAIFRTSDASIVDVDKNSGSLNPLKAGKATVSIEYDGKVESKNIVVRELRSNFDMTLGNLDALRGMRQDRVFAINFYNGGAKSGNKTISERVDGVSLSNIMNFGIKQDDSSFDINWQVDGNDVISISENKSSAKNNDVFLTFLETGAGKTATVSAYMEIDGHPLRTMKRSFKFNIFPDKNAVNISNLAQANKAFQAKVKNVILQDDIIVELDEKKDGSHNSLEVYSNYWGNGFSISGETGVKKKMALPLIAFDESFGRGINNDGSIDKNDKLVFDDITIKSTDQYKDESDVDNMCVGIYSFSVKIDQVFRYVQLYNCTFGFELRRPGNLLFEGCIIGDNLYAGTFIRNLAGSHLNDVDFVTRNCVYKNSLAPSIAMAFDGIDSIGQAVGKNSLPNVKFEGEVRFYNWQDKEKLEQIVYSVLKMVMGTSTDAQNTLVDVLMKIVKPFWVAVMESKEWNVLFKRYGKKQYASMSLFVLGGVADNDASKLQLGNNFTVNAIPFEMEQAKETTSLIKNVLSLLSKGSSVNNLTNNYLAGYNFNAGDPDIGPFDPVSESKELYATLSNGKFAAYGS